MSDPNQWQDSNARQLATALADLRLCLEFYIQRRSGTQTEVPLQPTKPPAPAAAPGKTVSRSTFKQLLNKWQPVTPGPAAAQPPTPAALPSAEETSLPDRPPPAFKILSAQLGLSQFEERLLLLCAAMELDTRTGALCARAHGDPNRPFPTFALALALFDEPAWDAISPARPLRYYHLIEISQSSVQPLASSPLRADERIVNYIKGLNYLDDRLSPLLLPLDLSGAGFDLPESQQQAVDTMVRQLKQAPAGEDLPVIQLLGIDGSSKRLVAARAAAAFGLRVQRLPAALLPSQASELETLRQLWERESLLLQLALYVDAMGSDIDSSQAGHASPVSRLAARVRGVAFLDTRDAWPGLTDRSIAVDVAKPTPAEQEAAWKTALGESAGETPAQLASQFNLGISKINQIIRRHFTETASPASLHDALWDACLASTRPGLDTLAQRLEPKATWDDLVLPDGETNLLRQIAAQVGARSQVYRVWGFGEKMSRGFGISALFAGDSGTGKTMAAEVIANELRLNLYRIDLSSVVSKYIGETEKNLRRLFDQAEDGGAILFFDEADALFGKRSEVKDSHDRYANIEINYLLQRMEAYRGLAILATNMKSALDQAFMRRLRFVVNFPFPGVAERKAIWRKVFPSKAPAAGLDFDALARLNLTGGNIQSIALNATFLAAQARSAVTQETLTDAARTELRKLGRIVNELEFRRIEKTGVK